MKWPDGVKCMAGMFTGRPSIALFIPDSIRVFEIVRVLSCVSFGALKLSGIFKEDDTGNQIRTKFNMDAWITPIT